VVAIRDVPVLPERDDPVGDRFTFAHGRDHACGAPHDDVLDEGRAAGIEEMGVVDAEHD
jgi:hypothetical protein